MNAPLREPLTTEIDAEVVRALRTIAEREGAPLEALVEEALVAWVRKREGTEIRANVMAAYQSSHEAFAPLYKKLAE